MKRITANKPKWLYQLLLGMICSMALLACCKQSDGVDVNGKNVSLSDYRGKWVIINYWASWCDHCKQEMPELQNLAKMYPDKVCVIGVNYDGKSAQEIQQFQKQHGVTFPMLQKLSLEKYGADAIDTLPKTFIICPQGILRATLSGPQTAMKIALLTNLTNNP